MYNNYVYTQTHAYTRIAITYRHKHTSIHEKSLRIHTNTRAYTYNHYVYTQTHAYARIIIMNTHKHMRIHV